MRKRHWFSLGVAMGLLFAAGYGFARPGRQPSAEEIRRLFPFFPEKR